MGTDFPPETELTFERGAASTLFFGATFVVLLVFFLLGRKQNRDASEAERN